MQLTGKQIVEKGIVIGACSAGVQQQGVDVRLMKVSKVGESAWDLGYVPAKGKTGTPTSKEVMPNDEFSWRLEPGYYEIEFQEGCKIPSNAAMYFKTRSSLVRCGAIVHSG
jgi:deoxycytidine triphosphate deaminase